jgi:glycosyltransferase involved in cell wall biosynthesis
MRILFVNPYYRPYLGGIERVIEKMSRQFIADPEVEKVGVLTSYAAYPGNQMRDVPPHEVIDGVHVHRLHFWPRTIPHLSVSPGAGFFNAEMHKTTEAFGPDVIQLTSGYWWPVNYQIWRSFRGTANVFYSLFFHDFGVSVPARLAALPIRYFNGRLTNGVAKTILVSATEVARVQRMYGTRPEQMVVIPLGVDAPPAYCRRARESVTILSVGRISRHKGQDKLLDAYLEAKKSFSRPTRLLFVGRDEDLWPQLQTQIGQANLREEVHWLGEVSENGLVAAYAEADVFALASAYESFGLVFLEAASHGLPLVTWNVGAIKEVLDGSAVIGPAGDTSALAQNLVKLVNDASARSEWSMRASQLAQGHSWQRTAAAFLELYRGPRRS